jgi:hypothetical protein
MLLSASRDKSLIIWDLTRDETQYGYPKRSLHGHSHIVSDCVRSTITSLQCIGKLMNTRSSRLTVPMLFLHHGTRLCACGSSLPATRPAALSATPTMSSPSPSPPITDRSSLARATGQSNYGTPLATASTPSQRKVTLSGSRA